MKNTQKLLAASLAFAAALSLAACGGAPAEPAAPAAPAASAAETVTIKVGASPAPHAQLLEQVKPMLAEQGITLEIVEFTDYVMPNKALDAGDIDANFFQHLPYLENFNVKNDTKLSSAGVVHYEPLGVYPGKTASIEALADGATIAVMNDTTNEARALLLLQQLGLIKVKDGAGLEATPLDIVENPKNLKFQEMDAALLVNVLPDVDLAVINGNFALSAGIEGTVLTTEQKASDETDKTAKEFANVVAIRTGDDRPELQKLITALQSDAIKKYIEDTYAGTVQVAF